MNERWFPFIRVWKNVKGAESIVLEKEAGNARFS